MELVKCYQDVSLTSIYISTSSSPTKQNKTKRATWLGKEHMLYK